MTRPPNDSARAGTWALPGLAMNRLPLTTRSIKIRLFLTCWLVFVLHFATDFVREHYLVVSIVEDHSFALNKYLGLHVDIFENPPDAPVQGAHHGANPGISMIAAIPYFMFRPAVDAIVKRTLTARQGHADTTTAVYDDPRWRRVEFYQKVRRQGLDVRFGLVEAITLAFCMAPLTALSVVLIFSLLLRLGIRRTYALGMSVLYAFGTPVFFRTAYLNQNLGIGIFALGAFYLLWDPGNRSSIGLRWRYAAAGFLGGLCLLSDYSGVIALGLLGLYGVWRRHDSAPWARSLRDSLWYAAGAALPVILLFYYQWASFGHPFYPPQHWMPPVEYIDIGYQGIGRFSPELFPMLLLDPRFGLFITAPVLVLGLAAPFLKRTAQSLPARETAFCLMFSLAFVLFFSLVQYTRLQWVTGIRYLAPVIPFLFVTAVGVLLRLPRILIYAAALLSVGINWSLAMVRDQGTVVDNIVRVVVEGFQLPWLTVLSKTAPQYLPWLRHGVSPLALMALWAAVITIIWTVRNPWKPLESATDEHGIGLAHDRIEASS